jgi:hypothetical protein
MTVKEAKEILDRCIVAVARSADAIEELEVSEHIVLIDREDWADLQSDLANWRSATQAFLEACSTEGKDPLSALATKESP